MTMLSGFFDVFCFLFSHSSNACTSQEEASELLSYLWNYSDDRVVHCLYCCWGLSLDKKSEV